MLILSDGLENVTTSNCHAFHLGVKGEQRWKKKLTILYFGFFAW